MNPHAQVDRRIVAKRSKTLGEPERVRSSSRGEKTGKRPLHQGQGAQNKLQIGPMSREEPREEDHQMTRSNEGSLQPVEQSKMPRPVKTFPSCFPFLGMRCRLASGTLLG